MPDGMGHNFAIPLKSIELNRNLDQIIDQLVAFAQRGAASSSVLEQAQKGFLAKVKDFTLEEINLWKVSFALMVELVKSRRDTVWGFILKNAFRPAYLRRSKVDVIVGNPPWLSFRDIAEPAYKVRIKDLIFGYGLLDKSERQLFTQMDTSTLFFVHCLHEFLKPGGTIASSHAEDNDSAFEATCRIPETRCVADSRHEQSDGVVVGLKNQHFFNVKSCIVISDAGVQTRMIPMTSWYGVLTRKNVPLSRCRHRHLGGAEYELLSTAAGNDHRTTVACFRGLLLRRPHTLWFVEPDGPVTNVKRPALKTLPLGHTSCAKKRSGK